MAELTRPLIDDNILTLIDDLFRVIKTVNISNTAPSVVAGSEEPVITFVVTKEATPVFNLYIQAFGTLYKSGAFTEV